MLLVLWLAEGIADDGSAFVTAGGLVKLACHGSIANTSLVRSVFVGENGIGFIVTHWLGMAAVKIMISQKRCFMSQVFLDSIPELVAWSWTKLWFVVSAVDVKARTST